MDKRTSIITGMALGILWAIAILWGAANFVKIPVFAAIPTILTAYLAPGIVMALMVARLAQRRFFDDEAIDGGALAGAADIDARVLRNTAEQLVLAICIWPGAALILTDKGPGVVMVLGLSLALTRMVFWVGYHISPPLRAFGFSAGFFPSVFVAVWALEALILRNFP